MEKSIYLLAVFLLLKVNSRNTRARFEICLKLTVKILKQRQCCRSDVFVVNFEHISKFRFMFLLLTLNRPRPIGVFLLLVFMLTKNFHLSHVSHLKITSSNAVANAGVVLRITEKLVNM